jgi:UDP-GlcNAc:undecaprenyl-phosphate GlcNAc-1-phosphate transferase
MISFSILLLSMFITIALIPILRHYAVRISCIDEPCERKVHISPVPKVGGIAMTVGVLVPVALWTGGDHAVASILIGTGIIAVFGLVDDIKDLSYRAKFTGQLVAALVAVFFGGVKICRLGNLLPEGMLLPDWLAVAVSLLAIIGVTNAVNLADGLDGLAGGLMLLCFVCLGFLAYKSGYTVMTLLAMATAGSIFGFLRFNTHPATIFMGDTGSQMLGFLAITMSVAITQGSTVYSRFVPLLLLGLPVLDTVTVMVERIHNGKSPFLADKNHLHHKLMRLGLFHTEAVFVLYVLQAGLVTTAFFLRFHSDWILILVCVLFAGIVLTFFYAANKKGWRLERPGMLDRLIKHRLKIHIKEGAVMIKFSKNALDIAFPLVLLATCGLPDEIPSVFGLIAGGLSIILLGACLFKPNRLGFFLRAMVYFVLPIVVYFGEINRVEWLPAEMLHWLNLSFGALVFFAVLVLKFTRRKGGFKVGPLDFIILFVAIIIPNLPDSAIRAYHAGPLAAKIVVFFFVFEVLVGELRGQLSRLGYTAVVALAVLTAKGFV